MALLGLQHRYYEIDNDDDDDFDDDDVQGGRMESRRRHLSSGDLETTSTVDFCPQVATVLVIGDVDFALRRGPCQKHNLARNFIQNYFQISHQPRRLSGKLSPCPEIRPFPG